MQDFINFVARIMEVNPTELTEDTTFGSIEKWDSLMHMKIVMEMEEEYDVEIPIEDIANIKSIKAFYSYI